MQDARDAARPATGDGSTGSTGAEDAPSRPTGGRPPPADADPARRPGVPREAAAGGAAESGRPFPQPVPPDRLRRARLDRLTPVVGTAQPPAGVSGALRRVAYRIPEHRARHWMLLMAADRVDVVESRAGEALRRPVEALGLPAVADAVRRRPAACIAGGLAAAIVAGLAALRSR